MSPGFKANRGRLVLGTEENIREPNPGWPSARWAAGVRVRATLPVAFEGERDQALYKVLVWQAARGPELRVDARRGEARDGVDLVEEQPLRAAAKAEGPPRHA